MSFFKDALEAVGNLTGIGTVKDAADIVINAIKKDPDLETKLKELELEYKKLAIKEADGVRGLFKAEIASEDPYIRRARPTFLYVGYILIALDLGILSFANALSTALGGPAIPFAVLPQEFYGLFTVAFTGYAAVRTVEKVKNGQKEKMIKEIMDEINRKNQNK